MRPFFLAFAMIGVFLAAIFVGQQEYSWAVLCGGVVFVIVMADLIDAIRGRR